VYRRSPPLLPGRQNTPGNNAEKTGKQNLRRGSLNCFTFAVETRSETDYEFARAI